MHEHSVHWKVEVEDEEAIRSCANPLDLVGFYWPISFACIYSDKTHAKPVPVLVLLWALCRQSKQKE